jgi:RNA polymerase-interacting CarD/CdnL/TRCF family regulator
MQLTVGAKVVYPGRGPCLVGAIVQKVIDGASTSFYPLAILDDSSGQLFVPVNNRQNLQIRCLIPRSEIPKLLDCLSHHNGAAVSPATAKTRRQRAVDISRLFTSGSPFDLATVVESLSGLNDAKALTPNERDTLRRARKLLACEISEAMSENQTAAEARIDNALAAGKAVTKPNLKLCAS